MLLKYFFSTTIFQVMFYFTAYGFFFLLLLGNPLKINQFIHLTYFSSNYFNASRPSASCAFDAITFIPVIFFDVVLYLFLEINQFIQTHIGVFLFHSLAFLYVSCIGSQFKIGCSSQANAICINVFAISMRIISVEYF